jgi:hypothetical protein
MQRSAKPKVARKEKIPKKGKELTEGEKAQKEHDELVSKFANDPILENCMARETFLEEICTIV